MNEKLEAFIKTHGQAFMIGCVGGVFGGAIGIQRLALKRGDNIVTANRTLYADGIECIEVHLKSGQTKSFHRKPHET